MEIYRVLYRNRIVVLSLLLLSVVIVLFLPSVLGSRKWVSGRQERILGTERAARYKRELLRY